MIFMVIPVLVQANLGITIKIGDHHGDCNHMLITVKGWFKRIIVIIDYQSKATIMVKAINGDPHS